MKIHGTAKGGALSNKDFGVAFLAAAPAEYVDVNWGEATGVTSFDSDGSSVWRTSGSIEQWNNYNRGQECNPNGILNFLKTTYTGLDYDDAYAVIGYTVSGTAKQPPEYDYGISWQPNNVRFYYGASFEIIDGSTTPTSTDEIRLEIEEEEQRVYFNDVLKITRSDSISGSYYVQASCFSMYACPTCYKLQGSVKNG